MTVTEKSEIPSEQDELYVFTRVVVFRYRHLKSILIWKVENEKRFLKRRQREQRVLCNEGATSWLPWTVLQKDCKIMSFVSTDLFDKFIMPGIKSEKG